MAQGHLETELIAYLRDELAPEARLRARRHLDECPECAATLADYRELLEGLARSIPEPPAIHPGAYRAELRDRLQARQRGRRAWWRPPVPLTLSASVAAAALLLVTLYSTRQPGDHRDLTAFEETAMGVRLEMIKEAPVVEKLDLLEDLEIIRQLDRVAPTAEG